MPNAPRDPALAEFWRRVRERRLALGLSQEAFAHSAGLHRTYIGGVESGARNVALLNVLGLASALGCDAGELLANLRVSGPDN